MRSWMSGRRVPLSSDYAALTESGSTSYRFESDLGTDAQFIVRISAQWAPAGNGGRKLVFSRLYAQAAEITRQFSVLDEAKAGEALADAFEYMRRLEFPSGTQIKYAAAELMVEAGDRDHARKRADLEKEKRFLAEIRDTFLNDTATAGLWWAGGDHDRVLELGAHRDKFAAAVNLVNGTADDHAEADRIGELIGAFLSDLGPEHRTYLLGQLERVFSNYGREDLAEQLRLAD